MKQMKVGIVGTGLIASLMAKTLNGLNDENIKNYAVASRTLIKAKAFADEYKIESPPSWHIVRRLCENA